MGQGFAFDGVNEYVKIPRAPGLDVGGQVTIDFWMKPDAANSMSTLQGLVTSDFYGVSIAGGGPLGIGVDAFLSTDGGASWATTAQVNGGGAVVSAGQWHHIAASYDGTKLQLYVDGQASGNPILHTGSISPMLAGSFVALGSEDGRTVCGGCIGTRYLNGLVDEVDIFNRALSASEIAAIYNANVAGKCVTTIAPIIYLQPSNQTVTAGANASFSAAASGRLPLSYQWQFNGSNLAGATATVLALTNVQPAQAGFYAVVVSNVAGSVSSSNAVLTVISSPPCAPAPSGLVSWWRGEGSAVDSADSNDGTLLNGASFAAGMVGQAFSFNGSNQCVQIPYAPSLVNSNYSVEAWVKPLAQVSDAINQDVLFGQSYGQCQLLARTGSTGVRVAFAFGTDHFTFYEAAGTSEIPIGQFTHLAGTWDGTTLRLYINGVLNAQGTPGASPVDSGCAFQIGGFYSPAAGDCSYVGQFFNGLIDEVSYYKRALSGAEIQSIYNAGGAGKCPSGMAPSITQQPASETALAGSSATFTVAAAGTPPLSYQWRFSGTDIAGATGTSLTLSNVQPAQAGIYTVRVTNAFGSAISSDALLTVNHMLGPVAECVDVVVSAGANCQADASVNGGSFDPDGDPITVRQVPPGPYPLGTNRVTLIVTDSKGASNSCSALVIVLDRTPPVLDCPGGKVLEFRDETRRSCNVQRHGDRRLFGGEPGGDPAVGQPIPDRGNTRPGPGHG